MKCKTTTYNLGRSEFNFNYCFQYKNYLTHDSNVNYFLPPYTVDNKAYEYNFESCKRTILTSYNDYRLVDVPKHTFVALVSKNTLKALLMGIKIKIEDKYYLEGMELNGMVPFVCGEFYCAPEVTINYKLETIKGLVDFYWNSTFPYYPGLLHPLLYYTANRYNKYLVKLNLNGFEESTEEIKI